MIKYVLGLALCWKVAYGAVGEFSGDVGLPSDQLQKETVDKTIRFNEDHEFTILQLTDLHYGTERASNENTTKVQRLLIEKVRPDLIVITGDAVSGDAWDKKTKGFFENQWREFTMPYLENKVKYAYVFGNHDTEADLNGIEIGELEKTHPFSLFQGSSSVDSEGYSNYVLPILSSFEGMKDKPSSLLWMFDTRKAGCDGYEDTYGCIDKAQISWYKRQSEFFKHEDGSKITGLGFFHVPLPEFMDVWNTHYTYGSKRENVACPTVNSKAFTEFKAIGNIKGLFCGHDHKNDYGGLYKGIELVYGRISGGGSYTSEMNLGGRVIKLKEELGQRASSQTIKFHTYIIQEDGSVIPREEPHWQGYKFFQDKCLKM
jgi:hypothetical protein